MKKIKYNPFSASSIVFAILMYVLALQSKLSPEFEIDPNVEDDEDGLHKFIAEHQGNASQDSKYVQYAPTSFFRRKGEVLLAWAACKEGDAKAWKPTESKKVQAALIGLYGNLTNPVTAKELVNRLLDSNQDAQLTNLAIKGESLIRTNLLDLVLGDKKIQKKLIDSWKKDSKAAEAPSGSEGGNEE